MLKLIRQEQTNDYLVYEGRQELGMLHEMENEELGHCWIFCAHAPGLSKCRAFIYSSPETARCMLPAEFRDKKEEPDLYEQSVGMIY